MSPPPAGSLDRRSFLARSGAAAAGALAAPLLGALPLQPADLPRHWAWVHGGRRRSEEQWRERFALARRSGIGGVLVSGGETSLVAGAARAEGLAFHRWVWTLNRSGDAWVIENHPEWFGVNRRGESCLGKPPYVGYYQWLCPSRPEVRAYLREWARAIAASPEVEGIHLDYIRHPDVILPVGLWSKYGLVQDRELPEYDFCYCEVCRELFREQAGTDPLELPDPTADERWRRFRWEGITGVVETIAGAVAPTGKPLSAAVFPTPSIARRLVRQAWESWPLQAVFPMLYHRFYEEELPWIGAGVREGVAALDGWCPLQAGLYVPDLNPGELAQAASIALEAGARGIALFELDALEPAHWERLAPLLNP